MFCEHVLLIDDHAYYVTTISYDCDIKRTLEYLSIMTELQHYWKDSVKNKGQHEATDIGRLLKSVDDDGNTPLHLACKHGFLDVAKNLIKMPGADIGAR